MAKKLAESFVCVFVAAVLHLGFTPELSAEELGVCITGDLNLDGIEPGTCLSEAEIDLLLDRAVRQGTNNAGPLEMTHPEDFKRREPVVTCRQYFAKTAEDYYAMTGADMAAESWYRRTCGTLKKLMAAKSPERSFLSQPALGLSNPSVISVRILPTSEDGDGKEIDHLAKAGLTLADMKALGRVKVHEAQKASLDLTYKNYRVRYHELARADFDHDGLNDILLFMGVRAVGGSMAWYETIAISRKRTRGLLETVTIEEPNITSLQAD